MKFQSLIVCINHIWIIYLFCDAISGENTDVEKEVCHPSYYHRPQCNDYSDGYGCRCGPGFVWNSKMCVAIGLDSRLEFLKPIPLRYAIVLNKRIPQLESFSIAMWVKLPSVSKIRNSTLISYSVGGVANVLQMCLSPTLVVKIHDDVISTNVKLNRSDWVHVVWTQNISGEWQIYLNGAKPLNKGHTKPYQHIPSGGELVLGQASQTTGGFEVRKAFLGSIAFVNVWSRVLTRREVKAVFRDCTLTLCGDAVQWADFRSGTRGGLRIRWPSFVYGKTSCFVDADSGSTCEKYCSNVNGAKCRAETISNVDWPRTLVGTNATVPCPGQSSQDNSTYDMAWRQCESYGEHGWRWLNPDVTLCTSQDLLHLKNGVEELSSSFIDSNITEVTSLVGNVTHNRQITNPFDLATVIDTIDTIINKQRQNVQHVYHTRETRTYGINRKKDAVDYPTWPETQLFLKDTALLLESLLNTNNIASWTYSKPRGNEGDHFLQTVEDFFNVLAHSLDFHLKKGEIHLEEAVLESLSKVMNFTIKLYHIRSDKIQFPIIESEYEIKTADDETVPLDLAFVSIPKNAIFNDNASNPDYVIVTSAILNISKLVPNHDIASKNKEDNVNSVITTLRLHVDKAYDGSFNGFITTHLPYLDTFNISNPECVQLIHRNGSKSWYWTKGKAVLTSKSGHSATCQYNSTGWYSVTTDMYDVKWKKVVIVNPLMEVPSYIGCLISSIMCLISVGLLMFYKTTSKTAALHKQFGGSIVMVQVIFMIGINRTENTTLCHGFAIAFHYFFLSTFLWLMNEAFNLYIVITYAAHSHSEQTDVDSGFDWRYFLLGWVLPGVLVGAFVGAHVDDYYADDMCWIAWQYIWLFIGPAIGIISVIVLILIFTAKEQNESSYSKNEDTNKMIILYSKAVWTQVILLTVCWAFAILSLKMRGSIIKWIYALFNTIQGAFFAVFYFWLNDEVRVLQTEYRKRNNYSSTDSLEEHMELTQQPQTAEDNENDIESSIMAAAEETRDTQSLLVYARRRLLTSHITEEKTDTSSDDSEFEHAIITTSV